MKKSLKHRITNKAVREYLLSKYSRWPQILVTEYPKSGGSWVCEMLSDYLRIPFPRNKVPNFCENIMHGHYVKTSGANKTIHVVRDGRDVMISFYYHSLFVNDLFNENLVEKMTPRYNFSDKQDVQNNLPIFMEDLFTTGAPFGFSWVDFVESWYSSSVVPVNYESLLTDCLDAIESVITQVFGKELSSVERLDLSKVVNKFNFSNQKKLQGENSAETTFLRSGKSGQWRSVFNNHSKEVFKHFAGNALIKLGYEKDNNW